MLHVAAERDSRTSEKSWRFSVGLIRVATYNDLARKVLFRVARATTVGVLANFLEFSFLFLNGLKVP
jgi:hypothetical protein